MGHTLTRSRKLLDDITIENGPVPLLGEFFLRAEAAARDRGVFLSFSSIGDFVAVNNRNRSTWRPLIPIFDPDVGGFASDNGFCILGRNRRGDVVATQAARLYCWPDRTFYDAATSLDLYYSDAPSARARGETCEVTARTTRNVSGRVVFSGGGWYHPDFRGCSLSVILPRISRALAFARWKTDVTVSMMAEAVVKGGVAERCGYTDVDWDVRLKNFAVGDLRLAFMSMRTDQLLGDLAAFSGTFGAQIDRPVDLRRAN
jgi:hypothetical protein